MPFTHLHHRYPKPPLLAYRVEMYACLGRHPRTQIIFFGTMEFKHHHQRYPETLLLAYRVQWYGCLGRPRTQTIFFALCSSNIPIIDIQNHLRWPTGYRGMDVWGATPDPKQLLLALCSSNSTIIGIQEHLCWPMRYRGMGVCVVLVCTFREPTEMRTEIEPDFYTKN